MRVAIDRERCTGCGICEELCPQVFTVPQEIGLACVKAGLYIGTGPVSASQEHSREVWDAVEECPCAAILVNRLR